MRGKALSRSGARVSSRIGVERGTAFERLRIAALLGVLLLYCGRLSEYRDRHQQAGAHQSGGEVLEVHWKLHFERYG